MSKISPVFSNIIQVKSTMQLTPMMDTKASVIKSNDVHPSNLTNEKKVINIALNELKHVTFDKNDVAYLKSMGVQLRFNSGHEAVDFINRNNIKIKFYDISLEGVFAQFDTENNSILLNSNYRNTTKKAEILALSEAIFHEAGHAKDLDSDNSVQEEIDNLSLNVLAHKFYLKKYPQIFNTSSSSIVQDGVNAYEKLFFDTDQTKQALINRLKIKYGSLPATDIKHPMTELSRAVKESKN